MRLRGAGFAIGLAMHAGAPSGPDLRSLAASRGMLESWLGPLSAAEFRASHLHRLPLARAATARNAIRVLDWDVLDRVLRADPDVIVVAGGHLLEFAAPRSQVELRAYFRIGVGLCLRHTERCDPGMRAIADAFERDLGASQVQIFVTPGGTHGFGWHYDDEDVFIAQTAGCKDYYFRANTVTTGPASRRAFGRYSQERSPLSTASLVPGDFLYIPARWWHMAICREDALSISVGVLPRAPL